MKFSELWLRTLCNPPLSSEALCDKLTMSGLEVEEATPAAPPFANVVVARIDAVVPHPDADRLRVCSVDVGGNEKLQIVCGAPNAAVGMLAPCALEGAILPGGLTIKRTTVRGVESRGMLCSAKELGINDDASGLLALDPSLGTSPGTAHVPGTNLRDALALDDKLITLKLTPNRADCLCLAGIAREVAAITDAPAQLPEARPTPVTFNGNRTVRVMDAQACPRFVARLIDGIDPQAPTPAWMKQRIERCGIRSISAVVDITNYVMLEVGQPLHAYDDRLLDGDVIVRFAREGEQLTLLNGEVLDLEPGLLLVADEKKPLGLAGIMGGEHSGIADDTTRVYLEGAFWNPAVIQGKMRRLGFSSDAGYRFERGVDFDGCVRAVERATQLIIEICGGHAGPLTDAISKENLPRRDPVRVRTARVARILGVTLSADSIAATFTRLKFAFTRDGDDFVVTPPSFRFDLGIEEDFIEEAARMYGYDAIPARPAAHVQHMLSDPETRRSPIALKHALADLDWQEIVTFSFVDSNVEAIIAPPGSQQGRPVRVLNPIASQRDVMRTTLLPGLIETLQSNLNRKEPRIRLFEMGRTFHHAAAGYAQPTRLGGLAYGDEAPEQWQRPARSVDFYDVKGDLEALVAPRRLTTVSTTHPALHPGRSAAVAIDGAEAGWLGELHPRLVRHFDLPRAPVVFELAVESLGSRPMPAGKPVSRLPIVRRDVSLVVDEGVPAQSLLDALNDARPPHVDAIRLFDVYRGHGLTEGKKSLAILVLMQDTSRTLTDADIAATEAHLLAVAREKFGATLRQ